MGLGLLAAAFIIERVAPPEASSEGKGLPSRSGARRDASTIAREMERAGRGRQADSPSDIPAKGWKDILFRVYGNIGNHRILSLAAGMTYYSILAIFPALAALVAIYGVFSDPASIAKHLDQIAGFVPGGALDVAREQLTRVTTKGNQTLGLTFAIGLVVSLWSANAAMKSLFDTLNIVYDEKEKRNFLKLNAISLSCSRSRPLFSHCWHSALSSLCLFCLIIFISRSSPTCLFGLRVGQQYSSASRLRLRSFTASGQAARRPAGVG